MKAINSDTSIYKKLILILRTNILSQQENTESEKELRIIRQFYPRGCSAPKICGLPKIHKTGGSLRHIVVTFLSPVFKLGKWLSVALRPLCFCFSEHKNHI